jgi:hypothetical protein
MVLSSQTPRQLIEALQGRSGLARDQLHGRLRGPVCKLLDRFLAARQLSFPRDVLVRHALHAAEIYLRTRPPTEFTDLGWTAFLGSVLVYLAKTVLSPARGPAAPPATALPLPDCPCYENDLLQLPSEQIGSFWYGGDWIGGQVTPDGSLWVVVADVTGHGLYAHLLAAGLPNLWRACWEQLTSTCQQPTALLLGLHTLLEDTLPEGVFVEATLARFTPDGTVTVVPAGGSRLLLRQRGRPTLEAHALKGSWLGLLPPDPSSEHRWTLSPGDELLLGSDGLFDQLTDHGRVRDAFSGLSAGAGPRDTLFQLARAALEHALRQRPQQDDITLFTARRGMKP